jgi:hypothetical protein
VIFEIQAHLGFCEIFGGPFENARTDVDLRLSGDYFLITADLHSSTAGQAALDLFAVLNEAFGLSLPDNFLLVEEAGFFTYSSTKSTAPATPLPQIFPESGLPVVVSQDAEPQKNTSAFWFSIQFASNALFSTLIEISADPGKNTLVFQAVLKSGAQPGKAMTSAEYYAALPTFKLFKLFEFRDVTLFFQFSDTSETYQVQGTLSLKVFDKDYSFFGRVTSSEAMLDGCVALSIRSPNTAIDDPFGGMPGIDIHDLVFAIQYTYATKDQPAKGVYRLQGKVTFGDTLTVTGQLYLENSTPVMASVLIGGTLDIGNIFSQCLPGLSWPSDFINIVFEDSSRLYYLKEAKTPTALTDSTIVCSPGGSGPSWSDDPQDMVYKAGFNAFSYFTLTLLIDIPLAGTITIASGKGVSAAIQLRNPIELWVLAIKAPHSQTSNPTLNGPIFSFDSAENVKKMGFACRLDFFQTEFLELAVSASKGPKGNELYIRGVLTNPTAIPPFLAADTSMTFSYCRSQGFRIDDWPDFYLDGVQEYIDFFKEIKEIANSSGNACGKIGDFVKKNLLTSKFKAKARFETEASHQGGEKDKLYFVVTGEMFMYCLDEEFGHFEPDIALRIELNNAYTFTGLLSALWQAIEDAAEQFVTALMNNDEAISAFLVFFAGQQAVSYAASLACKGLSDGDIVSATEAGASAFEGAGGFAGGVAAIAAVVAAIASSIGSSCFVAGTRVTLADGQDVDIQDIQVGDLLLAHDGGQNRVTGLDRPRLGRRALYGLNRSQAFVTSEHPFLTPDGWKALDPSATHRENPTLEIALLKIGDHLCQADGSLLRLEHIHSQPAPAETPLYNVHLEPGHSYIANGYIVHNKGGGGSKNKPPAKVETITLSYAPAGLTVTWKAASGAQSYDVVLQPPAPEKARTKTVSYNVYQATFDIPANSLAGLYTVTITAKNDYGTSTSSPATIFKLETPGLMISLYQDQNRAKATVNPALLQDPILDFQWAKVIGAATYRLSSDQQVIHSWSATDAVLQTESLTITPQWPAGDYALTLVSVGPDHPSTIPSSASPVQTWVRLSAPTDLTYQPTDDHSAVLFRWTLSARDADSVIELKNQQNTVVYSQRVRGTDQETDSLTIPLGDLPQNAKLSARVRAVPTQAPGQQTIPSLWSESVSFDTSQTAEQIAAQCFAQGDDGIVCAQQIIQAFPHLPIDEMALSMKQGGYPADQTARGLVAVYTDLQANTLASALAEAYQILPVAAAIAQAAWTNTESGSACAKEIRAVYPDITLTESAIAMAVGGYPPAATASGILSQQSTLSATALSEILIAAYRRSETS